MPLYISSEKIAYLGGIIDGEGCIVLRKSRQSGTHLCRVMITNSDEGILNECRSILHGLGIYFIEYKNKNSRCTEIEICRILEAKALLEKVFPYLYSYKREKALSFLQYVTNYTHDRLGRKLNRRKKT